VELKSQWIEYQAAGVPVRAYMAWPKRVEEPLPAVLVIQEVWGVDGHIQDLVRRFATAGYAALAPDLYSHGGKPSAFAPERIEAVKTFLDTVPPVVWTNPQERDKAVAGLPEPERTRVGETLGLLLSPARPMEQYVTDLRASVAYLRAHGMCQGQRIGATGYCMGGGLSALLACVEPELSGAAIYYGSAPSADRLNGIRCPLLGFYGGEDLRITEGVPAFADALRKAGKAFEYHIYPGAPHAFFNDERRSYRVAAARDAWARTLAFFAHHLTPAP